MVVLTVYGEPAYVLLTVFICFFSFTLVYNAFQVVPPTLLCKGIRAHLKLIQVLQHVHNSDVGVVYLAFVRDVTFVV